MGRAGGRAWWASSRAWGVALRAQPLAVIIQAVSSEPATARWCCVEVAQGRSRGLEGSADHLDEPGGDGGAPVDENDQPAFSTVGAAFGVFAEDA